MAAAASSSLPSAQTPAPYTYSAPSSPQISTRPRPPGAATTTAPTFKAPAHKHAHHLHSIPPREKSTRTLILDYLLWVHARTRLHQARAELGMTINGDALSDIGESPRSVTTGMDVDRESTNAVPFDQEVMSDGEDVLNIKFGAKNQERNERSPAEDEHEAQQNLQLAHALRLRADGVEKVLIAMLDQPPEVQPPYADEDAPRTPPAIHGVGEHFFPNGVRFRLTLSTLVNDLFARDIPTPLSPRTSNTPAYQARNAQTPSSTPHVTPVSNANRPAPTSMTLPSPALSNKSYRRDDDFLDNSLPSCLLQLASISSFSIDTDRQVAGVTSLPSFSSFTRSNTSPTSDRLPPILSPDGSSGPQLSFTTPGPRRAAGRALSLYESGTDPSTANSPPSLRCPRHLHHKCQICAPAQSPSLSTGSGPSFYSTGASPRSPVQSRSAISLGSNGKNKLPGGAPMATGLASWKSGAGIGAGLMSPGAEGTVLRRRTTSYHATSHPSAKDVGLCSQGGKLAELIPRFIRLSALVAVELGREAKEKEDESLRTGDKRPGSSAERDLEEERDREDDAASTVSSGQSKPSALKASDTTSPYLFSLSFRPTREWYGILAGLLTRAVLEGYLSRGWKGPLGMECLLGVGLGLGPFMPGVKEPDEDEFIHLDPDECPSLANAAKILFPYLCRQVKASDGPEAAYEAEMLQRISEFLTVPASTPDLSTHFEDLAYKYPTEPVERATVRFCEAVASWRGPPELESQRKRNQPTPQDTASTSTPSMSIDSLVQSASGTLQTVPLQKKSPIEKYFTKGLPLLPALANKRRRSTVSKPPLSDSRQRKPHFETPDDWTGPYGI
ncbi:uncharacterized protein FOMMEDRAFT_165647 [Fomitiporia mediterranea MF3/22]|uniref:uncharacterized protein n=1 Tax=Fomitiporia mediterranea (strain MF3/22) TaxID=694068 RepID=UPI0004409501|nr:uncharacterized protein FOMMEDRAFT_165647 [Fomitiporia mediterranea MF3/22]EJD07011.1 hypothetical protein FOMMEDRAFT_165647 [Fomitiporia mediterranea MF3/22]